MEVFMKKHYISPKALKIILALFIILLLVNIVLIMYSNGLMSDMFLESNEDGLLYKEENISVLAERLTKELEDYYAGLQAELVQTDEAETANTLTSDLTSCIMQSVKELRVFISSVADSMEKADEYFVKYSRPLSETSEKLMDEWNAALTELSIGG
jgi:hypothetical protein